MEATLTYEQIIAVTHTPPFIIGLILAFIVPLIVYLLVAGNIRARTSNGSKLKRSMLSSPNAVIYPLIAIFVKAPLLIFLFIFPVWAKLL